MNKEFEIQSTSDEEFDASDSRRTWVRNILGATAAVGLGLSAEGCAPVDNNEKYVNELIKGKTEQVQIKQGDTMEGLWEKSGYKGTVSFDVFETAVKEINPFKSFKNHEVRTNDLVIIPVKEK